MYIEEYVPIITPVIMAKEKPLNISPPRKNIDNKANKVVTDVKIVLDKVSLIDWFVRMFVPYDYTKMKLRDPKLVEFINGPIYNYDPSKEYPEIEIVYEEDEFKDYLPW